ncbi:MAG: hypothetical protein K2X98_06505, partial [Alphaproteobacteria bacterium]|nr:hypothetical protein [Alphaproteobacteria bacterium]
TAQISPQEEKQIQNSLAQFWDITKPGTSNFKKMCDKLGQEILELVTVKAKNGLLPKEASLIDLAINEYLRGVYFLANPGRFYKIGRGGFLKSLSSMTLIELNQFFHLLPAKMPEGMGQFHKVKSSSTTGKKIPAPHHMFTDSLKQSLTSGIQGMETVKTKHPHTYIHIGGVSFYLLLNQIFPTDAGGLADWADHLNKRPWFVSLDILNRVLRSFWIEKNYIPMPSLSALMRQIILGKYDGIDLNRSFKYDDDDYAMLITSLNLLGTASYTLAYNEMSSGGTVPKSKHVFIHAIQNNLEYFFGDIEKNSQDGIYMTDQDLQNDLRHRLGAFSITLLSLWSYEYGGQAPSDSDSIAIKSMLTKYIKKTESGCELILKKAGGSKDTLRTTNQPAHYHYCKVEPWLKNQKVRDLLDTELTEESLQKWNSAMRSVLWTEPTQTYMSEQPIMTQQPSPQKQLTITQQPISTTGGPQPTSSTDDGSGPMKKGKTPPPPPPSMPKGGISAIKKATTSSVKKTPQNTTVVNRPDLGSLGDALTEKKAGLRSASQTPPPKTAQSNVPEQEKSLAEILADAMVKHRFAMKEDAKDDDESDEEWSD